MGFCGSLKVSICGNFENPEIAFAEGFELFSCLLSSLPQTKLYEEGLKPWHTSAESPRFLKLNKTKNGFKFYSK